MGTTSDNLLRYETTECTRCGGSGRYSFNLMHGSVCYGCGGTGKKLTPLGERQKAALIAAQTVPVEQLQVGWKVWTSVWGGGNTWQRIVEIEHCPDDPNGNPFHVVTEYRGQRVTSHVRAATPFRANLGMVTAEIEALKARLWAAL